MVADDPAPSDSYNQTRNVMMNYEVLVNIYKSLRMHTNWMSGEISVNGLKQLPYSELITGGTNEKMA